MKLRSKSANAELLGGRYRLGEKLGAGAMADVHAAVDERLDREVAVKLLRPELAHDPDVRRRFDAEARAAAALAHPNIVAVFDVDSEVDVENGTHPYLVMERLPGRTLADEKLPMDPSRVIDVGEQLLSALHTAHRAGIVHRDVKPGNVLRAPEGPEGNGSWKVADFGIAKSTESMDVVTLTGSILCTPGYVAPERLAGEAATPASDLFSVGVVLYEMLAGTRPFVADTPLGVAQLVQESEPKPLSELRPDLDPRLVDVVHRALSRDPKQRFADAAEMSDALAAVRDPFPQAVPEPKPPDDTIRIEQPNPTKTRTLEREQLPEPEERGETWDARWLVWGLFAVAVFAIVLVVLGAGGDSGSTSVPPGLTTESTQAPRETPSAVLPASGSSLPDALENALDRLEESIRP